MFRPISDSVHIVAIIIICEKTELRNYETTAPLLSWLYFHPSIVHIAGFSDHLVWTSLS